jgi:outer membrane autotransporter protein
MATIDSVLQPYFEFNAWDDQRETAMLFDNTRVAIAPVGRVDEYNAGLSVGLANGWSGWASLGVQNGDRGMRGALGQVGARYRF